MSLLLYPLKHSSKNFSCHQEPEAKHFKSNEHTVMGGPTLWQAGSADPLISEISQGMYTILGILDNFAPKISYLMVLAPQILLVAPRL